jgi:hypothetical protein
MRLYHFTGLPFIQGILEQGIFKGLTPIVLPDNKMLAFLPKTQWLTSNRDYDQPWTQNSTLPYDRTEFRLSVEIPDNSKNLVAWAEFKPKIESYVLPDFDNHEDAKNWYIYQGNIPRAWIVGVESKSSNN